ncbi:hypothetical protein N8766_06530, partial [bacterium]|nr:hypothetical protein [bacterium]
VIVRRTGEEKTVSVLRTRIGECGKIAGSAPLLSNLLRQGRKVDELALRMFRWPRENAEHILPNVMSKHREVSMISLRR